MTDALQLYLREAAARPFAWGSCDCCLFAADWVVARRGIDPAASFRGRYASEGEAAFMVFEAGSLVELMSPHMATSGFEPTTDAQPGDVGVIAPRDQPTVAVRVRRGWACKSPAGIVVTPAMSLAAWKI